MMETRILPDHSWCLDTYLRMEAPGLTLINRAKTHPGGRWHTASLTYDGKTMTSYVDGVRELSGDVAFEPLKAGRTSIGVRQNLVSWFKGRIRLVRYHAGGAGCGRVAAPAAGLKARARLVEVRNQDDQIVLAGLPQAMCAAAASQQGGPGRHGGHLSISEYSPVPLMT